LRPVAYEDAEFLYELESRVVSLEKQQAWIKEHAYDRMFIGISSGIPVGWGMITDFGYVTELSWSIHPGYRGLGLGKEMARALMELVGSPKVMALIEPSNLPSRGIAKAIGLQVVGWDKREREVWSKVLAENKAADLRTL
jgi:RimJ/RimL family protein N-acetyltransferase